jgi:hypothetical protein
MANSKIQTYEYAKTTTWLLVHVLTKNKIIVNGPSE